MDAEAQVPDGNLAVLAHPHGGLLAKDIGPPGASWDWAKGGAVFALSQVAGGLRSPTQLPMELVGVGQELIQ